MIDTLLHSGEFSDNNGDVIRVSFYKRLWIEVLPVDSISTGPSFYRRQLQVFVRGGEGSLSASTVDWVLYTAQPMYTSPGTNIFAYDFVVMPNDTGNERSTSFRFTINTGPDAGKYIDIPVTQSA